MTLIRNIEKIHLGSRGTYGSPRIYNILKGMGFPCSKTRVERLMKEFGIKAKTKRKYRPVTTDSKHKLKVPDNILNRNFSVLSNVEAWAGDITYIKTEEGWLYLAVTMDLRTRRVVGWAMSEAIDTELVKSSFLMAYTREKPKPGVLYHSDRGVQYAAQKFKDILNEGGFIQSMSRKGDCYDNSCVESFFHSLKGEYESFEKFKTRGEAKTGIFEWIEVFYNRERSHSTLDFMSPENYTKSLKKIS